MSSLFENKQTEEVDALSEARIRRFEYYQSEIDREYAALTVAAEKVRTSSAALAKLLRDADQEGVWKVDGYHSMSHWVSQRWKGISRSRLSQLLTCAEMNALIEEWEAEMFTKFGFVNISPLEEGPARALKAVPEEDRKPTFDQAVEMANGRAPSARQITEAHEQITANSATDARIGTLDTEKGSKKAKEPAPVIERQRHRRGWVENYSVDGKDFVITACDHPFTVRSGPSAGKVIKPKIFCAMPLWKVQTALEDAGLVVLSKTDTDGLKRAYMAACEAAEADDEPDSDARRFTRPEPRLSFDTAASEGVAERTLADRSGGAGMLAESNRDSRAEPAGGKGKRQVPAALDFYADDCQEEPEPAASFTAGMDLAAYDALAQPFGDEWAQ